MSTTPTSTTGTRDQRRPRRPLPEDQPRDDADDEHLEVAQHGRQARPDALDGVVPEHEVAGEEDAGDGGQPPRSPGERPVAPVLHDRHEDEQGQPEHGPIDRAGRGRDRGVPVEDPGEGDAQRPDERRQARAAGDGVERRDAQRCPVRGGRGRLSGVDLAAQVLEAGVDLDRRDPCARPQPRATAAPRQVGPGRRAGPDAVLASRAAGHGHRVGGRDGDDLVDLVLASWGGRNPTPPPSMRWVPGGCPLRTARLGRLHGHAVHRRHALAQRPGRAQVAAGRAHVE